MTDKTPDQLNNEQAQWIMSELRKGAGSDPKRYKWQCSCRHHGGEMVANSFVDDPDFDELIAAARKVVNFDQTRSWIDRELEVEELRKALEATNE